MTFFDRSTLVLNVAGVPPKGARTKWLLWPVVAYRAIVPEPQGGGLNLFQRAVLGLATAGARDITETSDRLCLPPDLVAFVVYELQARSLLDSHGHPTPIGTNALGGGEVSSSRRESALVFVDAISGRLWSRVFASTVTYATGEVHRQHATVKVGTTGYSTRIKAAVVHAQGLPPAPSPRALLQAFRTDREARARHQQVRSAAQERRGWTSLAESEAADRAHASVDRVSLAGATPTPLYIPIAVYVPGDLRQGTRWRVSDPFGLGDSSELLAQFQTALEHDDVPPLRDAIADLEQQQVALSNDELAEAHDDRRSAAERSVASRVGDPGSVSPDLWKHLVKMEENVTDTATGAIRDASEDRHRAFLRHAYSALEQLLADSLSTLPTDGILAALNPSDGDRSAYTLLLIADKLGFEIPPAASPDRKVVESLFRTTQVRCRHITEHGGVGLPDQLAVAVLMANRHPAYPLTDLAERHPDALTLLGRLRQARNAVAHGDNPDRLEVDSRAVVFDAVNSMLALTQLTTGGLDPSQQDVGLDLDLVFLVRARHDVDRAFGTPLRSFPALLSTAVRHRAETLRASRLLEIAPPGLDRDALTGDLAIHASAVLEKAAALWLRSAPSPDALALPKSFSERISDRLHDAARGAGALGPSEVLPDDLAAVKSGKVASALTRPATATLSALIAAALLCAEHDPEHPAAQILPAAPHLIGLSAEVVRLRGHGGPTAYSEEAFALLSEAPHAFIDATLNAL